MSEPDATQYHDGQLDDVRIYNRVLSATEVAGIYAQTNSGDCAACGVAAMTAPDVKP